MFETLTRGFRAAKARLTGKSELTGDVIDEALRDIRLSLLEADVDFNVTKQFLERVKTKAVGEIVTLKAEAKGKTVRVTPVDHFVAICQRELVEMMGPVETRIDRAKKGQPTGIMMVGLQGSGKTTTVGKLARFLMKKGHHPLLVAADVYRPAAIDQLQVLGQRLKLPVYAETDSKDPPGICQRAMVEARAHHRDMVIFDTAGRLAIDEPLMMELEQIQRQVKPKNVFLVCDAMIGQDAVNTAREFHRRLDLTGVILTKLDGDARGGAAISVKAATGAPIKFLGMGEALDRLEEFRPEGLAGRILGMGDVVGLMKDFEEVVDARKAEQDAMKLLKGRFSLNDFVEQIRLLKKMGSLEDLFDKMPFFPDGLPQGFKAPDERELGKVEAIISSMTRAERTDPELFTKEPKRLVRVAKGSGRTDVEVKDLLNKFMGMRKMIGDIGAQAGLLAKIPGMRQLAVARKLKDAVRLQGGGGMQQLQETILEAAVAAQGGGGGKSFGVRVGDHKDKKKKRKDERKARKKGRR
ncbi:MAG: signal recognition particle protein [Deltaproteobacteria bacterium]|nr:signal recognition particle protein [Deltaproteobacteria bacterium]